MSANSDAEPGSSVSLTSEDACGRQQDSRQLRNAHDTEWGSEQRLRWAKTPAKMQLPLNTPKWQARFTTPAPPGCPKNRQSELCLFFGQCRFCRFWAWQRVCGLYHSDVDVEMTHGDVAIGGVGREVGAVSALLQAQGCSEF